MRTPITLGHKSRYAHDIEETGDLERRELMLSLFGGIQASDRATVGRIPRNLALLIGSQTDIVQISPITVMKVRGKHATVLHYDLELLQHGFATGRVQQDTTRTLIFLFRDPRKPQRTLKAVVKAARRGEELLISTYHVCTGKNLTNAMKRGKVIRDDRTWPK